MYCRDLIFKLIEEESAALLHHLLNFLQKQPFLFLQLVWIAGWLRRQYNLQNQKTKSPVVEIRGFPKILFTAPIPLITKGSFVE